MERSGRKPGSCPPEAGTGSTHRGNFPVSSHDAPQLAGDEPNRHGGNRTLLKPRVTGQHAVLSPNRRSIRDMSGQNGTPKDTSGQEFPPEFPRQFPLLPSERCLLESRSPRPGSVDLASIANRVVQRCRLRGDESRSDFITSWPREMTKASFLASGSSGTSERP